MELDDAVELVQGDVELVYRETRRGSGASTGRHGASIQGDKTRQWS